MRKAPPTPHCNKFATAGILDSPYVSPVTIIKVWVVCRFKSRYCSLSTGYQNQKEKNRATNWIARFPFVAWWAPRESNTAPTDYESAALTKHELGAQY